MPRRFHPQFRGQGHQSEFTDPRLNHGIELIIHQASGNVRKMKIMDLMFLKSNEHNQLEKTLTFAPDKKMIHLACYFHMKCRSSHFITPEMSQHIKDRVYREFKTGDLKLLFTTSVSRQMDVPDIQRVIHYDNPVASSRREMDIFLKRSNLTGRFGKGEVHLFIDPEDANDRHLVTKLLGLVEEQGNGVKFESWVIDIAVAEMMKHLRLEPEVREAKPEPVRQQNIREEKMPTPTFRFDK